MQRRFLYFENVLCGALACVLVAAAPLTAAPLTAAPLTAAPLTAASHADAPQSMGAVESAAAAQVGAEALDCRDVPGLSWSEDRRVRRLQKAAHRALGGDLRVGIWPSPGLRSLAGVLAEIPRHDVAQPDEGPAWTMPSEAIAFADRQLVEMVASLGTATGSASRPDHASAHLASAHRAARDQAEAHAGTPHDARAEAVRVATCRAEHAVALLLVRAHQEFSPTDARISESDLARAVSRAVDRPEGWLADLVPAHPDYPALVRGLAKYRWAADSGGWRDWTLPDRLRFEGWLQSVPYAEVAQASAGELRPAIEAYQRSVGIPASGELDELTRAALDRPAHERIAEIRLALSKWRRSSFREHAADALIWVNLPTFQTELWERGRRVDQFRSVIGAPHDPTPTLDRTIHTVQFNPPWFVPPYVAVGEMAALEAEDEGFLAREGFREYRDRRGRTRLVQAPGEQNWLGRAILRWSARDAIYIHGSPFRDRFDASDRALSHGCVNVEHVERLAGHLLRLGERDSALASEFLQSDKTTKVRLRGGVRAVFDYIGVTSDDRGRLLFRLDVYDRDRDAIARYRAEERTALSDSPPAKAEPL